MSLYGRFLAGVFPSYAVRRIKALSVQNSYDAEKASRTFRRKKETRGPNLSTMNAHKTLREVVREMEQNNDLIVGALDVMVANIVGGGCFPEPMILDSEGVPNVEINDQVARLWERWAERPEVTWEWDEASAQRLMCRTWFRDGEVFARHHKGPRNNLTHGSEIPYSYEMMEPDLLVTDERILKSGGNIIEGVELSGWRRPIAYHFYKQHPADNTDPSEITLRQGTVRVPADSVTHLKLANRIGQVRGITKFSSVIKRLNDVGEIDETERVAARVAAAFAAVIVKGDPQLYEELNSETGQRELSLNPGMIFDDLMPGESVQSIGSNRPNNELIPFRASQLRAGAGGIGISYSSWSKDYSGTYSSQRQELVEQHRMYTPVWAYFIKRFERVKYKNFIDAAILSGQLKLPSGIDEETLYDAIYTQPVIPWIQPQQEAAGWKTLYEMGAESKAGIIRMRGKNPREIEKQRALEDETNGTEELVPGEEDPNAGSVPDEGGDKNLRRNRLGGVSI